MISLAQVAIFLLAAVIAVPISQRLGFGAVLGYLVAGMAIGPSALAVVDDADAVLHFGEYGVVMLLFLIGLELKPQRLWTLRRQVFGLGGAQVVASALVLGLVAVIAGVDPGPAALAGIGLALSSTAFVLPMLAEKGELAQPHGRAAFSVLLFQDLAVIPVMALIPLLGAAGAADAGGSALLGAVKAVAVLAGVIVGGRYILRPLFRMIAETHTHEIFVATALLVVIGVAVLMTFAGLSMSLGAFIAGMLLADSEYRHEIQADLEPFKGLLLGLFFMAVGMSADFRALAAEPVTILGLILIVTGLKAAILFGLGRVFRMPMRDSLALAAFLAQGGEFAFVLFTLAVGNGLMPQALVDDLILVVIASMIATPFVVMGFERLIVPRLRRPAPRPFDAIDEAGKPVIIAGFGRFGQIVGRVLRSRGIGFTAIDGSAAQVDFVRRFGNKIYYGDPARLDILRAAEIEHARAFVLAMDDVEGSVRCAETLQRHFPNVPVFARARNRQHAFRLMDLGVKLLARETYFSSLHVAEHLLVGLGFTPSEAERTIARFREHDERLLAAQHAVKDDEKKLMQTSQEAAAELKSLFEADAAEAAALETRQVQRAS